MVKIETFADSVVRELWRPHNYLAEHLGQPAETMRNKIMRARKFVLDDRMSRFMADLSQVPFKVKEGRRPEVLHALRRGAKAPHPLTWVEYNGRAFRERLLQVAADTTAPDGKSLVNVDEVVPIWGYLIEQHHQVDGALRVYCFAGGATIGTVVMPYSYVYQTNDEPLPWLNVDTRSGQLAVGITGERGPFIGVLYHEGTGIQAAPEVEVAWRQRVIQEGEAWYTHRLVVENAGNLRYLMAFLATLNDLPMTVQEVRPTKGYFARGRHRKFLDHTVIHLNIPARQDTKVLANKLVGMARRRAHEVRGHWRYYQRGPEEMICQNLSHEWAPTVTNHALCTKCPAWRTWIEAHQRGDASKGFVTHDYTVSHELH